MQLVDFDDAEQEPPEIELEMKSLDLQHGRKRPIGIGGPHIVRFEAKYRKDLEMKVATELNVQIRCRGELVFHDSNQLTGTESLDQDLACDHHDDDRSGDHCDAPLSNQLHFIGSEQRNLES
jgi:hypothetical protein